MTIKYIEVEFGMRNLGNYFSIYKIVLTDSSNYSKTTGLIIFAYDLALIYRNL